MLHSSSGSGFINGDAPFLCNEVAAHHRRRSSVVCPALDGLKLVLLPILEITNSGKQKVSYLQVACTQIGNQLFVLILVAAYCQINRKGTLSTCFVSTV